MRVEPVPISTICPDRIEADYRNQFERLEDRDGPYGCYRRAVCDRPDLYASVDVALMRGIMQEDLTQALSDHERDEWVSHINSFADSEHGSSDGSYFDRLNLGKLHANGQVIGALGLLGGKKAHPCELYLPFNEPASVKAWLESEIDWSQIWSASHQFWGGAVFYSQHEDSTTAWLDAVINWLDNEADPETGWWRKDIKPTRPFEQLGGAAHILPVYQHHDRTPPHPEKLVDSVLAMQDSDARWMPASVGHLGGYPMHYLDMDALYILWLAGCWTSGYRQDDTRDAVNRYTGVVIEYYEHKRQEMFQLHPHFWMSALGIFGLLQRLVPERFDEVLGWTDIFSDIRLYQTKAVEPSLP